jgi:hypothetical protein
MHRFILATRILVERTMSDLVAKRPNEIDKHLCLTTLMYSQIWGALRFTACGKASTGLPENPTNKLGAP